MIDRMHDKYFIYHFSYFESIFTCLYSNWRQAMEILRVLYLQSLHNTWEFCNWLLAIQMFKY